ncbi:MAG: hypothetical protein ABIF01_01035, partial [Candidatus Micrarchaeota archaeon]
LYASRKFRFNWKETLVPPALAVVISLVFYLPIFLKSGLPYEIVPDRWGYFFTYGLNGMHFEFLLILPLIPLGVAAILKKGFRVPALAVAFFALVNALLFYRVNVILTVLFAGLFPLAFEKELRDKKNLVLVSLFLSANILITPFIHSGTTDWCTWGVANDMCVSPMEYLGAHTSTNERVVIGPMYGHLETYVGKRPVLADLYVEYADLKKFEAEDTFAQSGDLSLAREYDISIAVEDETVWPPRPGRKNVSIEDGDRTYDNGFFHITRLR